jgi:hypothetical protein
MNKLVPKKSKEQMKSVPALPLIYPVEKEPLQPGHLYGNDTQKQRSADREDWRMSAHPDDLPAGHVKIFWALRKMKTAAGKNLQPIDVS